MEKKIALKVNEIFQLQLDSLGGAGYSWVMEQNNEKVTAVELSGSERAPVKNAPVGGSLVTNVIIKGVAAGRSSIRLVQRRIWETDQAPLKTVLIEVVVTEVRKK
ncbi:protease inhibitor I42 family protein [Niabella sp. CC-SYL272]|uniref:protease inhibitor I42 family protein n=1 Tax=Niabella agricola TaxID=2891571 RepID=UPI001F1626CE|nr:protease inhibitor I42 family protein [Niabella agricola]MCF3110165.1 protease inhibitor I42 family protein [Niabella agricola]